MPINEMRLNATVVLNNIKTHNWCIDMLQFEISENCIMPKVVIEGNYYGSKTFPSLNNLLAEYGRHPKGGGAMKRKFEKICCDEIRMQLPGYTAKNPIILYMQKGTF